MIKRPQFFWVTLDRAVDKTEPGLNVGSLYMIIMDSDYPVGQQAERRYPISCLNPLIARLGPPAPG